MERNIELTSVKITAKNIINKYNNSINEVYEESDDGSTIMLIGIYVAS
jgi:ribosomal protein S17E